MKAKRDNEVTTYIFTRGRPEKQKTLRELPAIMKPTTILMCPESEAEQLEQYGVKIRAIPDDMIGIHWARQTAVEDCPTRHCFMLDDDLGFNRRRPDDPKKMKVTKVQDRAQMWQWVCNEAKRLKWGMIGIGSKQNNNSKPNIQYNSRITNAYCVDCELLQAMGIEFSAFELMEDFHVTLALLTNGIPNIVNNQFGWQQGTNNDPGGCSLYRTAELQEKSARRLAARYPDYVKLLYKESSLWKDMEKRVDVHVQWNKAYEDNRSKAKGA